MEALSRQPHVSAEGAYWRIKNSASAERGLIVHLKSSRYLIIEVRQGKRATTILNAHFTIPLGSSLHSEVRFRLS